MYKSIHCDSEAEMSAPTGARRQEIENTTLVNTVGNHINLDCA